MKDIDTKKQNMSIHDDHPLSVVMIMVVNYRTRHLAQESPKLAWNTSNMSLEMERNIVC